ncbi:MAG: hypothetical protein QG675_616 [Patescibacteria group bacterium]|jgi:hypothetical protein|nr:hypothetical protein [Patescibacteria group bacterium]
MSKNKTHKKRVFTWWIASLIGIFILLALVYFVAQYVIVARTNAPRIQIADDIAWKIALQLEKNGKIEPISSQITQYDGSATPAVVIYGKDGEVLDVLGIETNNLSNLPDGVLTNTSDGEKNIFSWQPERSIRSDWVVVSAGKYGYVLVSLDSIEIERSTNQLFYTLIVAFGLLSVAITIVAFVQYKKV